MNAADAQKLINEWLDQAATLRHAADVHRNNGMFETARGERLKADQLSDCAAALQNITPGSTP